MGLIINIIIVGVLAVVITGAVAYNNPQKTKVAIAKVLKKVIPEIIDINPKEIVDEFVDKLPKNIQEIIDKNPSEEKEFKNEVSFPKKITNMEILGRPKKVVEFFCTSDSQCKNYFLKNNAQCETQSGVCFISK